MPSTKINALTGTRAIAAIMVVIHHFGSSLFPFNCFGKLFSSGNLAVSYFFVLSGFVLFISQKSVSYFSFIKYRFLRIAPAYYIALFATILVLVLKYPPTDADLDRQIICSALFIQSFFKKYVLELNSPAWSLSVEMFFYLLYPLIILLKRYKHGILLLAIIFYISSQIIHLYYAPKIWSLTGSGIYFNPFIHLNQFLVGMCGGLLYTSYPSTKKYRYLPLILLAIIVMLIVIRPDQVSYQVGLIAPIFMVFILAIARNNIKWLSYTPVVFLGEISFGIYIYQYPIFKFLIKTNINYFHFNDQLLFYSCLLVLIILSYLSYILIEKPLNYFFRYKQ